MISTFNQMDLLVRRDEEISRVYTKVYSEIISDNLRKYK